MIFKFEFEFALGIWARFEVKFVCYFSTVWGAETVTSCSARRLLPSAAAVNILAALLKSFFNLFPLLSLLASTSDALPEDQDQISLSIFRTQNNYCLVSSLLCLSAAMPHNK